jgi:hypothetical protein
VRCTTYGELARYMDAHPSLANYGAKRWQTHPPTVADP